MSAKDRTGEATRFLRYEFTEILNSAMLANASPLRLTFSTASILSILRLSTRTAPPCLISIHHGQTMSMQIYTYTKNSYVRLKSSCYRFFSYLSVWKCCLKIRAWLGLSVKLKKGSLTIPILFPRSLYLLRNCLYPPLGIYLDACLVALASLWSNPAMASRT